MAASTPLVSIVLPTRNGARYLQESLGSCLGQTYPNLELVVVDDGSTDRTPEILDACTDPRLVRARHERGRGLPEALNTGFAHTRGEYLTWTSDDNYYAPTAIAELVQYLEDRPEIGLVYTHYWLIDADGNVSGEVRTAPPDRLIDHDCVGACFLYRRAVYEAIGNYNPAARPAEDYEYWLRVARQFTLAQVDRHLYYYRQHGESLTGRFGWFPAGRSGETAKLRLGWIDRREHRKRLAFIDICEAFAAYQTGDLPRVRRCALSALRRDPAYLRNAGVRSILAESLLGARTSAAVRAAVGQAERNHA